MGFDIAAAARNYHQRKEQEDTVLRERFQAMQEDARALIAHIRDTYEPDRIYQWGSLVEPRFFTSASDIDIAVEGIRHLETWLQLEKDLFGMTDFPLDLVKWESLWPEHREQILRRGRVVYEQSGENTGHDRNE